jgi:hypothetical protein
LWQEELAVHPLLLDSQDLADYKIGGMNMGWEVTGPFDVAVQVKDLKLEATVAVDSFYRGSDKGLKN